MADVIKTATREAYGKTIAKLGEERKDVIVLDADLACATKTEYFKKAFPDRFFDVGIAEADLIGIASGLSACGYLVFASSFAMFLAGRAFEQVRNSIGYGHLNVKLCATHAGISVGEDGASHQCCEDIALMRTIPGMTIINPADDIETQKAIYAAAELKGPVYMRFGRLAVPRVFDEDYDFKIGKGAYLREGKDAAIIASGLMVERALTAAKELSSEGIDAAVINMGTIKPLDKEIIADAISKTGLIITAEEHSIIGGLGSAVAEFCSEISPVPVLRVGVNDEFGRSGPALELLDLYGLNASGISAKVKQGLKIKK